MSTNARLLFPPTGPLLLSPGKGGIGRQAQEENDAFSAFVRLHAFEEWGGVKGLCGTVLSSHQNPVGLAQRNAVLLALKEKGKLGFVPFGERMRLDSFPDRC